MATTRPGLSLTALVILFSTTFLRATYASDNIIDVPLSPSELELDLDEGGIALGPRGQTFELSDSSAPAHTHLREKRYGSGHPYWYSQIKRQGKPAYGNNASYIIWRNVLDYGAVGDGTTDDTAAFQAAVEEGNRCRFYVTGDPRNCDSQTTTPAIVYVPGGRTYRISKPVIMLYYTHMIGDANDLPILKATADFQGIGILDSDPYIIYNDQWYENQNNFWRNVRNFVFDTTDVAPSVEMHGIHWQISQAASIMNCVFICPQGGEAEGNKHIGMFMENGSALFFEDLIFIGGWYGAFVGNQQFGVRNLTFIGCDTGLFQNWGWVWNYKSLTFNDCRIGLDLSQGDDIPSVGSIVVTDSEFNGCDFGIVTSFSSNSTPTSSATMVVDNVLFSNTDPAISFPNETVIVPGNQRIATYIQGNVYNAVDAEQAVGNRECYMPTAQQTRIQQLVNQPIKSPSLLDSNGKFYERSKPQYEGVPFENFKSILDFCCANTYNATTCPYNDGVTDATTCIQSYLDYIESCQVDGCIGFVDHGAYVITNTIYVPVNVKLQGEVWPMFMFTGPLFQDQFNPIPGFQVGYGTTGETGTAEFVEILFETIGPTPGLILMQWNLACTAPTTCGMWDTHFRIGGSNGTQLQNYNCIKNPTKSHGSDPACWAAFLAFHVTSTAKNALFSHNWIWIADHELDLAGKDQIDLYNGRGVLVESQGPIWMYGSGSEHSQLYNYQFSGASNIYLQLLQSETAYMQANPNALSSFTPQGGAPWHDPSFADCFLPSCKKTIGLRIYNSTYIYNYGAGLYSFFENYASGCILTSDCDQYRVHIEQSQGIYMYALSSIAANFMIYIDGEPLVASIDNLATFASTIGGFFYE